MNWIKTNKLNVPKSTDQWSLMIADDLLEARAYYDQNIGQYYWQAVVGEVPVGSGETATLEQAQGAAQDALWKFFKVQRDFWAALTRPSPEMGEGSKVEPFYFRLGARQAIEDLKSPETRKGVLGE